MHSSDFVHCMRTQYPLESELTSLKIDTQGESSSHISVINLNSDDVIPLDAQPEASLNMPSKE